MPLDNEISIAPQNSVVQLAVLEARSGLDLDLRQENNVSKGSKVGLDWVLILNSESVLFAEPIIV